MQAHVCYLYAHKVGMGRSTQETNPSSIYDQRQTWLDEGEELQPDDGEALQPVAAVIPPKVTPGNMIARLQRVIRVVLVWHT